MRKVIMLGGGGFAREVLETIEVINAHTDDAIEAIGFVYDGGTEDVGKSIHGIPVLGDLSYLKNVDFNEVHLTFRCWSTTLAAQDGRRGEKAWRQVHERHSPYSHPQQVGEDRRRRHHAEVLHCDARSRDR